jgi:hypothetical protein
VVRRSYYCRASNCGVVGVGTVSIVWKRCVGRDDDLLGPNAGLDWQMRLTRSQCVSQDTSVVNGNLEAGEVSWTQLPATSSSPLALDGDAWRSLVDLRIEITYSQLSTIC